MDDLVEGVTSADDIVQLAGSLEAATEKEDEVQVAPMVSLWRNAFMFTCLHLYNV